MPRYGYGWDVNSTNTAGIAAVTTSIFIVYAVMLGTRLSVVISDSYPVSCFVTDLGTVSALVILFTMLFRSHEIFLLLFLCGWRCRETEVIPPAYMIIFVLADFWFQAKK